MKKYLAAAAVAGTVGLAGLSTAGIVAAQSGSGDNDGPMSGLVTALAEKFNLDQTEVQQVFDDERTARQAERETEVSEKLAELVSEGKLTQEQSDAISEKRTELQAEREEARDNEESLTREERQERRAAHRDDLETWASENDISSEYLRYVLGGHGSHHEGYGFGKGN